MAQSLGSHFVRCRRAEAVDHPGDHVVDGEIGGGGGAAFGQRLENERRIQTREGRAAHIVAHIDAGHAKRGGGFQRGNGEMVRLVPFQRMGRDFLAREGARHVADGDLVFRQLEHVVLPSETHAGG